MRFESMSTGGLVCNALNPTISRIQDPSFLDAVVLGRGGRWLRSTLRGAGVAFAGRTIPRVGTVSSVFLGSDPAVLPVRSPLFRERSSYERTVDDGKREEKSNYVPYKNGSTVVLSVV